MEFIDSHDDAIRRARPEISAPHGRDAAAEFHSARNSLAHTKAELLQLSAKNFLNSWCGYRKEVFHDLKVSGTWCQVPGTWYLKPDSWNASCEQSDS